MKDRRERISRIRRSLAASSLEALLVTCPENRLYLSGFAAEDMGMAESAGALLITRREQFLLTDGRYEEQARREAPDFETIVYRRGLARAVASLLAEGRLEAAPGDGSKEIRIGYEPRFLTCAALSALEKATGSIGQPARFVPYGETIFRMRSLKTPEEIAAIEKAVKVAEEVFGQVADSLRPGMTEREVAFSILKGLHELADGPSFPPIVASGPNSALPHATPTDRRLREGEPIIIDMGARLDGYCSDMTRTLFIGEPDGEFRRIYSLVAEAKKRAQEGIRPGMSCKDADSLARKHIEAAGLGDRFIHSLGHGVGLAVHEAPTLSFRSRKRLRAGMVCTVEPGIYLPGRGGVRLEDMALLTEDGLEILNSSRWYYDFR